MSITSGADKMPTTSGAVDKPNAAGEENMVSKMPTTSGEGEKESLTNPPQLVN